MLPGFCVEILRLSRKFLRKLLRLPYLEEIFGPASIQTGISTPMNPSESQWYASLSFEDAFDFIFFRIDGSFTIIDVHVSKWHPASI